MGCVAIKTDSRNKRGFVILDRLNANELWKTRQEFKNLNSTKNSCHPSPVILPEKRVLNRIIQIS